ncbi:type VI secretion system tip protein TssI/VgrG [Photobacterium sp. TY1-4]|uniref:type VI secretion system tip protein TssI/VgrG n=1 Tax=Photobacterium sp. TY1-4 TaxID=2899122 RepID=UPI0021C113E2|nr:type VI secretion system tip protein TssI/VgrG [Photobacterium sp. TY1-4]UXI02695.1 type VI secretion system tip protein VgrG [Photobacterium sp. TY1-4]
MKTSTQENNIIRIDTPLGKDVLHLTKMELHEGISVPFSIHAYVYTNGVLINSKDLIGKPVSFTVLYHSGDSVSEKYLHGYVSTLRSNGSRVAASAEGDKYQDYVIDVCPSLDFSYQRTNCKIYQNLNIEDIVKSVLSVHNVNIKVDLKRSYAKYEYKVQYHETDFDFVHRLLEEEGIFYYFTHSLSSHTMVLCDDVTCYKPCVESSVAFSTGSLTEAHIHRWIGGLEVSPGKVAKKGYDFIKPGAKPSGSQAETSLSKQQSATEVFHYQAGSELNDRIQDQSALMLEALQRDTELSSGASNCRTFSAGQYFTFKSHEDKRLEGKSFLLTHVYLEIAIASQTGSSKSSHQSVHNQFSCVPKETLYRPKPITSKPRVYGVQTACVTGEKQDEIHIDKYGRVKVLFHWDREGVADNTSSCWIRVAQSWAGNGWGASFFPRVGQEVLVEFLDGDPDQPIITGALYNGNNLPPYSLPAEKSVSGIKTRSTKEGGGSNFNEIRFDDKKDNELFYLHAEKNYQVFVENDASETIKNNQSVLVENDRLSQVKNNYSSKVDNDRNEEVGNNKTEKVGNNKSEKVSNKLEIDVGSEMVIKCGGASIKLSSDGSIDIKGTNIKVNGSKIALKAGMINLN